MVLVFGAGALSASLTSALVPKVVEAAVPKLINFQGILKDGSGNPVANGAYSVTFTIYDDPSAGNVLWAETSSVSTTSGLFTVLLGSLNPVPDSAFQDTTRYLGVKVGADPEMTPRQQLVSLSYAYRVSSVDGASGGTITSKVSIGPGHTNTGTDAFVAGANNRARGAYSVVSGGGGTFFGAADSNSALGNHCTIGGGRGNTASDLQATVGGGAYNNASANASTIGGGALNTASGIEATIGGGEFNTASGYQATVGGGAVNTASGYKATVGGGWVNTASGYQATVGGGLLDTASGSFSTVGGGNTNVASGDSSVVSGGTRNVSSNTSTTIGGGQGNTASGFAATVGGGSYNTANGVNAAVGGGLRNTANTLGATVSGGADNTASGGSGSTVGGGGANSASAQNATVSGGTVNTASDTGATIGGGTFNTASGLFATIGGGNANTASGTAATVGGGGEVFLGSGNVASGDLSTVGGGSKNTASSDGATVGGGGVNTASSTSATVSGGEVNTASGYGATVPGGSHNTAAGDYSFAAGLQAKANHGGAFVWGDNIFADFASTGINQFLIRASGGVGIGTNSPTTATGGQVLHVNNSSGPSALRLGDDATDGIQWELQSTVIGSLGALNVTNVDSFTNLLTILGNGRVGIRTTAPAALLHVNGDAGNNTGVWSNLSDRRLKKDIEPIQGALETVNGLQGVSFRWKDAEKDAQFGRVRGLIAQDVEKVLPEWIKTDPDGYKRLEPIGIDALLIEAIKESKAENEQLRRELNDLRELVQKLLAEEKEGDKKLGHLR
jgi:hypothetical protein